MPTTAARDQIREFLRSRRARLTPQQVGLVDGGGLRRVPGLRREEVAELAAISPEYYTQIECGNVRGVSEVVLQTLMDALRLDSVERAYLLDLIRQANRRRGTPRHLPPLTIRPELQQMLDAMSDVAVNVRNDRLDLIGGNARAKALFAPAWAIESPNLARHVFLDPATITFSIDYDRIADYAAGALRVSVARDPDDADLVALIDELHGESADFRARWRRHPVLRYGAGTQSFRHPVVGELHLQHESVKLVADPGLTLVVYSARPGSPTAAAFARLTTTE